MDGPNYTILVVEDDENDILLLKRAFARAGVNNPVIIVNSGLEAISYLEGKGRFSDRQLYPIPKVLFIDLHMPRFGGFDILQWLQKRPELSRISVLVMSSSTLVQDVEKAYALGAKSYFIKPTSFDELQQIIQNACIYWNHSKTPGTGLYNFRPQKTVGDFAMDPSACQSQACVFPRSTL